jgi:hypothetical protein
MLFCPGLQNVNPVRSYGEDTNLAPIAHPAHQRDSP